MAAERIHEHIMAAPVPLTWGQRLSPLRALTALRDDLQELRRSRHVLRNLVVAQLSVRYHRSILGFCWTLLNPVLMLSVLAIVFSQVMGMSASRYAVYAFSGLLPWQFFAASITNGSRSLINAEFLITKISVQKLVFPLAEVAVALVNMVFAMLALGLLLQVLQSGVSLHLVLLPVGLVLLAAFTYGLTLIAMTLVTRWRDFEHIIVVALQAGYFFTPILYMPQKLPQLQAMLECNPMAHILAFFQMALYYGPQQGDWVPVKSWIIAGASAAAALALGYKTYKAYEHEYIFFL